MIRLVMLKIVFKIICIIYKKIKKKVKLVENN